MKHTYFVTLYLPTVEAKNDEEAMDKAEELIKKANMQDFLDCLEVKGVLE